MLTNLRIRNLKKLDKAEIELGSSVVFIGPNNSGKTTALQALALWETALRKWNVKRAGQASPEKRPGVTINRRDLVSLPVPTASLLWRDLHVRRGERKNGKQDTKNVYIDIIVDGVGAGGSWSCGFEFYYANEESFYCRPLRLGAGKQPRRMVVPAEAAEIRMALLPPMSGLVAVEPKLEPGRVNVLTGEGQTAQVLRNLCYNILEESKQKWLRLAEQIESLFGASLLPPIHLAERGEITMSYREFGGPALDLSACGRGMQQTLLLLAYIYSNPKSVLLIDEPDAHLEILRQRQIYQVLTQTAETHGSQIIAASHSEVVLNEAAGRDTVIAFVGQPHRLNEKGSQVAKALKEIGFEHYYLAEQTGWVLYLEGSTDLAILRDFSELLGHEATSLLEKPFVHYVGNEPQLARRHFYGLREAKPDLSGVAIYDRIDRQLEQARPLKELMWQKNEIENYLCNKDVLIKFARGRQQDDLFGQAEADRRMKAMAESIDEISAALSTLRRISPWADDTKVTDDFLDPLFEQFYKKLGMPNLLRKTDYHVLAALLSPDQIDHEIVEKLDGIVQVARSIE